MSNPADLARGWFLKGDSDPSTARLIAASVGPYDTACFHAQQAGEKYLKGLLSFTGHSFPFTHNLEELEQRCAVLKPAPDFTGLDLTQLTPYGVQLRYDSSFWPDVATAQEAINLAMAIRAAVLAVAPPETHP